MREEEWLDGCADEPHDYFRRYAFADWLDDRGDADRAEFIRCNIECYVDWKKDNVARYKQADSILAANREKWLGPLVELAPARCWKFRLGLPDKLDLSGDADRPLYGPFSGYARGAIEGQGIIRAHEQTVAAVRNPLFARVTRFAMRSNFMHNGAVAALADSAYVHRLVALNLAGNRISRMGAYNLARSPHLAKLETLCLADNRIGNGGMRQIAASKFLTQLRWLDVSSNGMNDRGAKLIAEASNLRQLVCLYCNNDEFTLDGTALIAAAFKEMFEADRIRRKLHRVTFEEAKYYF